jgi:hypothetical protein
MIRRKGVSTRWPAALLAGVALGLVAAVAAAAPAPVAEKVRVVVARNPRAVNDRNVCDAAATARLFDRALQALTGAPTAAQAWTALGLAPTDVVAVKMNCNNWTIALNPHRELVDAMCRSMETVVPAGQIILYDNDSRALTASGFAINTAGPGVRCFGTDQGGGFDPQERLTRIVTTTATKLINLASLKCVESSVVTSLFIRNDMVASLFLKNHIGSLIPEDMSKCHNDPDFLAGVSARPSIRDKTILNLLDGLRGTYRRGVPWYWAGIILSRDLVAAEAAAISVMNEKRAAEKIDPLPLPQSLKIAESKYKLGTTRPENVDLVRLAP